jgi:hypothetical protein
MLFLTPMMAMTRNWSSAATCALIGAAAYAGLHLIWLRSIGVSDEIFAETRTLGHLDES